MAEYIVTSKSDGAEVYRYQSEEPVEWNGMEFATHDHIGHVVAGVLKTRSGGDPFGGAVVNARLVEPGIAIGYSSNGTSGPSAADIAAEVIAAIRAANPPVPVDALTLRQFIGLK